MNSIIFENKKIIPSKIVCVGRNYLEHIEELGNVKHDEMIIFSKPNSSISKELYFFSEDTRYEGELCFLIKNKKIAGLGFGLDLTKENEQKKSPNLPWERCKAFDGAAIFSNFVPFDGDIKKTFLELHINDKLVQVSAHELMIYKPCEILNEIQTFMSLEDGDIIMSGTPKGVGSYKINDIFLGKIFYENKLLTEASWTVKAKP